VINAMREAYGLGTYVNKGITHVENFITGGSDEPASSSSTVETSSSEMMPASSSSTVETSSSAIGTTAIHAIAANAVNLTREGNALRSNVSIRLFDLNGNTVRVVDAGIANGHCEMSLQGLRQGMYIARSGNSLLRVQIR